MCVAHFNWGHWGAALNSYTHGNSSVFPLRHTTRLPAMSAIGCSVQKNFIKVIKRSLFSFTLTPLIWLQSVSSGCPHTFCCIGRRTYSTNWSHVVNVLMCSNDCCPCPIINQLSPVRPKAKLNWKWFEHFFLVKCFRTELIVFALP